MALVNLKQSSLTEQQKKEAIDLLVGKEGDLTQQEIAEQGRCITSITVQLA